MSEWTALNVEYMTDDWEMPSLDQTRVSGFRESEHGGTCDLLLDTFNQGVGDFVAGKLRDIALWHGDPVAMILVEGNDTTDCFDFKLIDDGGHAEDGWVNRRFRYTKQSDVTEEIEAEVGVRPSWGGNYREY